MTEDNKKPFYITTTLPYVNSKPHIGFALEAVRADSLARFHRLMGHEVFFNTGTDEHGVKIYQKAQEMGMDPQAYTDEMSEHFKALKGTLNLSYDRFIRTTDKDHEESAKEFWKKCDQAGYIYRKNYSGLYCAGCEMFVTEKDLIKGECPNHPGKKIDIVSEENYFFKFSAFTDVLKKYFEENKNFIIPKSRANEMKAYLERGLEDFSISRLKSKMPWGIPVPGDDEQVMYVWFDALVDYISTLGWPDDKNGLYKKFWENGDVVQICGKDNTQHQSLRWQAMLHSVGLPFSDHILINGFINVAGQKMSKTLGNVVDPVELVNEYGTDAVRYFFLRELSPHEDSDYTPEKFKEAYNANLVNGVGNLTNRIMKLAEDYLDSPVDVSSEMKFYDQYTEPFYNYDYLGAINGVWDGIKYLDEQIQREQPFKVVKEDLEAGKKLITEIVKGLAAVAYHLQPLMPETAEKIFKAIKENKKPIEPIFPRKD